MSTELAESSQALFCSLADYVISVRDKIEEIFDTEQYSSYTMFSKYWNSIYKNKTIKQLIAMNISINLTYISLALSFLELLKKNGSIPNE